MSRTITPHPRAPGAYIAYERRGEAESAQFIPATEITRLGYDGAVERALHVIAWSFAPYNGKKSPPATYDHQTFHTAPR
jgi:hypothetical protein